MNYWLAFVAWVHTVPDVIWSASIGAVLASGISYFGVRSANASSLERLRAQHVNDAAEAVKQRQHDAEQKDKDRKSVFRREVYTKAAEVAHALIGAIAGLPERPFAERGEKDGEPLQLFLREMSKVWLVADAKAAHLSREYVGDMAELFMVSMQRSMPIRVALAPIPELEKRIEHLEKEAGRITQWINELHETDATQEAKERASDSLSKNNDGIKVLRGEQDRVRMSVKDQRFVLFKTNWDAMMKAQMKMVSLISALREELNLPPDEEEFLQQHRDAQRRSWALVCNIYGVKDDGVTPLNA